ncbi:MAG: HIT family hydrolase [Planctomycetes bacterium RBG_16_64_12]|nr:MAG: HIT family hydrolase [Planctomycetes bacterium RBG_16_64_12]
MTHEQIWAPWRLAYVTGDDQRAEPDRRKLELLPGGEPECFICQAAADSDDRQRHVVERGEHSIVILNRYPYNNGHLLIAPCLHRARLDQLTTAEEIDMAEGIRRMVGLLERVLGPEGFNVGLNLGRAAGAGLPEHLHWHVVPRWNGDTNFMPTLAAIRVIPQSLDALWEALTAELAGQ